jgi:hypothetical protein
MITPHRIFVTQTLGILHLVYTVPRRNLNLSTIDLIPVNSVDVIPAVAFILGLPVFLRSAQRLRFPGQDHNGSHDHIG